MSSWKIYAALYTLGATGYAIGAKFSAGRISPLLGAMIMTTCSLLIIAGFLVYYRLYGGQFTYNRYGVEAAVFTGIAIALADIALFFMYAKGAELSIAGVFTEVISIAIIAVVGVVLLKEPLTVSKALGFLFSLVGIYFLFEG